MGNEILNLASLALGLMAWALPILYLRRRTKGGTRRNGSTVLASMTCCALALWCQMRYAWYSVTGEDWSALMDTFGASMGVSLFLVITTVLLNALVVWMEGEARSKD